MARDLPASGGSPPSGTTGERLKKPAHVARCGRWAARKVAAAAQASRSPGGRLRSTPTGSGTAVHPTMAHSRPVTPLPFTCATPKGKKRARLQKIDPVQVWEADAGLETHELSAVITSNKAFVAVMRLPKTEFYVMRIDFLKRLLPCASNANTSSAAAKLPDPPARGCLKTRGAGATATAQHTPIGSIAKDGAGRAQTRQRSDSPQSPVPDDPKTVKHVHFREEESLSETRWYTPGSSPTEFVTLAPQAPAEPAPQAALGHSAADEAPNLPHGSSSNGAGSPAPEADKAPAAHATIDSPDTLETTRL